MGNVQMQDLAPVRTDERSELDLGRKVTHRQYQKHMKGEYSEHCLLELPWAIRDAISLYEKMDVSFNRLSEIPVEIPLRLPHLNHVNISHNQLTSLPESLGLLFHLKTLVANNNYLGSLPSSFVHLVKLEKADLSHNQLRELPENMGQMESLRKLNVSNNKLKHLPVSLGSSEVLHVILAKHNRLESPPQELCNEGSHETLKFLRKQSSPNGIVSGKSRCNVFPRVRGNKLQYSVPNPHSALVEYIQAQTNTTNTPSRIKTPLLPPLEATSLDVNELKDKIIGLLYGAAIGDALGLATQHMTPDECNFHYDKDSLTFDDVIRDEHRVRWKKGDWTTHFDQVALVLDSLVHWAGVVDELDFAKRLWAWNTHGFQELGDTEGIVCSNTITKVTSDPRYLEDPHGVSKELYQHLLRQQEPDAFSDNGAVCRAIVLGIPHFHGLQEVESNALRICKATHADPRCLTAALTSAAMVALMLQGLYNLNKPDSVEDLIQKARELASVRLTDPEHRQDFDRHMAATDFGSVNVHESARTSSTFKPLGCAVAGLRMGGDYRTTLTQLVMLGGDSAANGCLTGALLGCKAGYSQLPELWVSGLRQKQKDWINGRINLLLDMMGVP